MGREIILPAPKGELGRLQLERHFTERRKEGAQSRKDTSLAPEGLRVGSNGILFTTFCPVGAILYAGDIKALLIPA